MKKTAGQVTILVLLMGLLGLTVALSLVSRSLSDLKQVTYVDAGTRALAAAEAGLQFALANANFSGSLDCASATDNTISGLSLSEIQSGGLKYKVCLAPGQSALAISNVSKDEVAEIDLGGANASLKAFDVSWDGTASVEIEVVDKNTGTNAYSIRRYAYNPVSPSRLNGFATAMDGSTCGSTNALCPTSAYSNCTGASEICYHADCAAGNVVAQLVRIKPLYSLQTSISVCGRDSNGVPVTIAGGANYYRIIVTATTVNGTVRRIQSDRSPLTSGLPAVFDNVLFSGSTIAK